MAEKHKHDYKVISRTSSRGLGKTIITTIYRCDCGATNTIVTEKSDG